MTAERISVPATSRKPGAVLALGLCIAALVPLLMLPLRLPIGPMYWDLFIYFDAANRIFAGQAPVNDFFIPVGPLGYYLFAGGLGLFPNAQPLLLVHWSLLAVTGPLLALVLWDVGRRSTATAVALLVPFLIFALLPFNTREFYPFPGTDGFGIYNRQVCQLLYVLVAGLVFCRNRPLLAAVVTALMAALFFTKITGFVAGLVLCVFAFVAGRIGWRWAVAAAAAFFVLLGLIEFHDRLVSNYLSDILKLVAMNAESLAPRFLQSASMTFGVVAPAAALMLLLLWWDREKLGNRARELLRTRRPAAVAAIADHHALWLGAVLFAGILFETQNTGSQAMIFVWPVLLAILLKAPGRMAKPARMIAVAVLALAAAVPPVVIVVERAARTFIGALNNLALEHDNLKTLGRVSARSEMLERAEGMIAFYPEHRQTYADLVSIDQLPAFIFYSEYDFQLAHLMAIDRAIESLRALEVEKGVRFETIMSLNFVNPFPWLMDRSAPKHIAIGADPGRAVPEPGSREAAAIRETDIVLYPTCPLTTANRALFDLYAPALVEHHKITLDGCFDAWVHPRIAARLR